jgi:AraC-like DNA-binding protein
MQLDFMSFSHHEIFSYCSSVFGLVISLVIFTYKKGARNVRWSLAFFLLLNSLIVLLGSLHYSGKIEFFPFLFRVDSPLHYLFGPLGYFYILASLNRKFKFRYIHLLHTLPFLINIIDLTPVYLLGPDQKIEQYKALMSAGTIVMSLNFMLKNVSGLFYLGAGSFTLIKSMSKLNSSEMRKCHLCHWMIMFLFWQFILVFGLTIESISDLRFSVDPYRFGINLVSLFLLGCTITLLFFPDILYHVGIRENKQNSRYHNSSLSEEYKSSVYDKLLDLMNSEEKPFLEKELTLVILAKYLNIKPQQLSQVINEKARVNFNDFINKYRVLYSKNLLLSADYKKYTITAISDLAGFKSKTTFYAAFKKYTGVTPKEFILDQIKT